MYMYMFMSINQATPACSSVVMLVVVYCYRKSCHDGVLLAKMVQVSQWSHIFTSIKIIKNEVGCRDDTVPKTVDTRRHCEEE